MKLKYKFEKFLSNKTLLNVVMIITFFNLIGYVMLQKTIAIVYFILIGLLTSFFSKNMTIVLGIPLILVNLFVANSNKWSMSMNYNREGLENNNNTNSNGNNNNNNSSNQPIKNAIIAKKNSLANANANANANNSSTTTSSSQGLPMTVTPIQHDSEMDTNFDNSMDNSSGESFEVGRSKKNAKGYNIDYASTVEDAYDELNKILGSDGIKRLTSDTQSLMKQQLQLAESMKSMQPMIAGMAPLMQQAQGLLGTMGDNGNLNNLADIAKKFSATLGNNSNTTN
jgi:hypothetical protein